MTTATKDRVLQRVEQPAVVERVTTNMYRFLPTGNELAAPFVTYWTKASLNKRQPKRVRLVLEVLEWA